MKKVYCSIIDTLSGIAQNGMIEEPVQEGLEVANALKHFGTEMGTVKWINSVTENRWESKFGIVEGTTKVVHVTVLSNNK